MYAFSNNASSLLAISIGNSDTVIQVASGEGTLFPSTGGGVTFVVALEDPLGDIEYCLCTSRSGDLLTVTRGQEGTSAQSWTASQTRVELRLTTAILDALLQEEEGDARYPRLSENNTLTGVQRISATSPTIQLYDTDADANGRLWQVDVFGGNLRVTARNDDGSGATTPLLISRSGTTITSAAFTVTNFTVNGSEVVRANSLLSTLLTLDGSGSGLDADLLDGQTGSYYLASANLSGAIPPNLITAVNSGATIDGITLGYALIPARGGGWVTNQMTRLSSDQALETSDMAEGRAFSVYNSSASSITITQGSGVTMRLAGTTTTGSRTLAARGMMFIWCNSGTEAIVSGPGVS